MMILIFTHCNLRFLFFPRFTPKVNNYSVLSVLYCKKMSLLFVVFVVVVVVFDNWLYTCLIIIY